MDGDGALGLGGRGVGLWGGLIAWPLGWRSVVVHGRWADVGELVEERLGRVVGMQGGLNGGDDLGVRSGSLEGLLVLGWCLGGCAICGGEDGGPGGSEGGSGGGEEALGATLVEETEGGTRHHGGGGDDGLGVWWSGEGRRGRDWAWGGGGVCGGEGGEGGRGGGEVEERGEEGRDAILGGNVTTAVEWDPGKRVSREAREGVGRVPGALVFAVSALHDFVLPGEDFLLEYLCASALFYAGDLEDLGRIDIRVAASAHDGDAANHALVDLERGVKGVRWSERARQTWTDE